MWTTFLAVFCGVITVSLYLSNARRRKPPPAVSFPPGPKPRFIIGNILDINTSEPWLTYTDWKKAYGDIVYSRLLGQNFIILNSDKVAKALMDQRSAIYSDRPVIATNKLFGVSFSTVSLPYGDEWRWHRKLFHSALHAEAATRYQDLYLQETHVLLENIAQVPTQFLAHLQGYVASIIMGLTYGYATAPRDDPIVTSAVELVALLAEALSPERAALLSALPFLGYIPSWFPGANFKRCAIRAHKLLNEVKNIPFDIVKRRFAEGAAPPSMVADLLSQMDGKHDINRQEEVINDTAATVFLAGFETSASTLHSFILAMLLYPDVQKRAQAEIDAVIDSKRLPTFEDRYSLPYVDAILREVLRWHPVVPLGIPHATSTDDVYEGYFIPKGSHNHSCNFFFADLYVGSLVIANIWAMARDEDKYSNVADFVPERHFDSDGRLAPETIASNPIFGYGRRICPGRFAAEGLLWAAIVSILATFHISKATDSTGTDISVDEKFTTGIAVQPIPFPCEFTPRSKGRLSSTRTTHP
ncbi:cytochrome P450 [Hygrophoropsis aurantiaca]|uniref:Cytochrome P450 n=1 Tax=Hygrophoropsis aurantiaca TaxID=72124 RepID=A0ACB8AFF6_9AGAM|nr:cytochrome P450 [Hygrophoropsis aurantiaca]